MTKISSKMKSYGDRPAIGQNKISPNYVRELEGLQKNVLKNKKNSVLKNLHCISMEASYKGVEQSKYFIPS